LESVTVRNKGWSAAALLALHDEVIAPILAGIRSPRRGRKPAHWTRIDRDYETLRIGRTTKVEHTADKSALSAGCRRTR